jgi:hypothetical protein
MSASRRKAEAADVAKALRMSFAEAANDKIPATCRFCIFIHDCFGNHIAAPIGRTCVREVGGIFEKLEGWQAHPHYRRLVRSFEAEPLRWGGWAEHGLSSVTGA